MNPTQLNSPNKTSIKFNIAFILIVLLSFASIFTFFNSQSAQKEELKSYIDSQVGTVITQVDQINPTDKVLTSHGVAFIAISRNHKILHWGGYAQQLFGYTPEEAADLSVEDLMVFEARPKHVKDFDESFDSMRSYSHLLQCKKALKKDGTVFGAEVYISKGTNNAFAVIIELPLSAVKETKEL